MRSFCIGLLFYSCLYNVYIHKDGTDLRKIAGKKVQYISFCIATRIIRRCIKRWIESLKKKKKKKAENECVLVSYTQCKQLWRWLFEPPTRKRIRLREKNIKEITTAAAVKWQQTVTNKQKIHSANVYTRTQYKINKLYFTWCDTSCDIFIVKDVHPLFALFFCHRRFAFEWLQRVHIFCFVFPRLHCVLCFLLPSECFPVASFTLTLSGVFFFRFVSFWNKINKRDCMWVAF